MSTIRTVRSALVRTAMVLAVVTVSSIGSEARTAWYGPGSGAYSPYKNYKGFKQVPPQAGGGQRRGNPAPASNMGHCVPNVGLVGANGVCP